MFEVREICRSYDGRTVLHPVSFRLAAGECLGVSGVNGSGKSTLLRLLAGVERPDRGEILYRGKTVLGDKEFPRRTMGYVPQMDALAEELTVAQQLSLWHAACGLPGKLRDDIAELMGLAPLMKKRISRLSGGMQRRVSIAMALASGSGVLVMDEATSGLDSSFTETLLDWVEEFLRGGGRVVWCSHHEEELDRLCSRRLVISEGKAETVNK